MAGILKRYVRRTLSSGRRWPGETWESAFFREFGIRIEDVVAREYDYDTISNVIYYRAKQDGGR